ncbi:MurR/RpiR family transcriptional regulator [Ohessyouella blattaphilus]|uniref:MurR/RpiR family transcriptional regulator n=1 Tax=Ohessyouella blattaphilus TaxID=2949333 RepID=A0ABT1EHJ1_9FIRM|nr:MurR/RpiR family transcriptional regulator [Ohessyouella blattaphilus]MCP1110163.1 MurR/RpiR family transcriptional regulator [Ohessyouella blattaphilus]MCR8563557.1 MurR/RpiR family transcriptional regulator [Ohessyouella blattaphilus]
MEDHATTGTFLERVEEKLDSLSKKERQTVEYMKANQAELIYASITELAEAVGTSEATVTRACTKLGYPSFQALKVSVATELVSPQEKIHEELTPNASAEVIIDKIFSSAIQTLTMTQQSLDDVAVGKSIKAICKCRRLVIIGNGNSGAVALDAQHKFLRIGMNVQAYTDDHLQMIAMVSLTAEDVLLAISHSGSSKDAGDAIQLAKEQGATVITITSSGNSPVANASDIRLLTRSQETRYRTYAISSRMAELTIIDTLYTGVALCKGDRAIANFEALEKALVVKKY